MHVKNSGLKVWNAETNKMNKIECPEYDEASSKNNQIDNIRATPDAKFIMVGFQNVGKILIFSVEKDEPGLYLLPGGKISVSNSAFI